ncbi:DinB family protein [Acidobacteria bacterium AB60]|nr:DinB family protein [Acidobacteria bacterium AB60]
MSPVEAPAVADALAQSILAEFEPQARLTRKFLERLPEDKLMWKPHEKSMTAGQLAYHLAFVPGGVAEFVRESPRQAPDFKFPQPASREEILRTLDESVATVRRVLEGLDDAAMRETWRLLSGDKELVAMPRAQFLRDIMLNHWYQHRGQFSVYLRILEVPVPATWGPSADEPPPFLQ